MVVLAACGGSEAVPPVDSVSTARSAAPATQDPVSEVGARYWVPPGSRGPQRSRALDLTREAGWPGRAMEPAVRFENGRLTDYVHLDPTTLRFWIPQDAPIQPGDEATVVYGGAPIATVVLPPPDPR